VTIRTVVLRGPFTEIEVGYLVDVMRAIEATRPAETFEIILDAPDAAATELIEEVNPLRVGYARKTTIWERRDR